jgi:hypothetical protein
VLIIAIAKETRLKLDPVAADLPINGGAVPAQIPGNLNHRHPGIKKPERTAAFIYIELAMKMGHLPFPM